MTDALRQELRGRPVRVTGIYPPNIMDISPLNEDQWNAVRPQASWVTNRDIVETVLFALSRPRHVTLSSILLESDTGNFFFN
jgi:NADP-dependent 3-hydroxy acid dehydrogenase YdfG